MQFAWTIKNLRVFPELALTGRRVWELDMIKKYQRWSVLKIGVFAIALAIGTHANAALTLTGGGLTLVEEGPVAPNAGDPVPANLATGALPLSNDPGLGPTLSIPFHITANLNDQQYGNAFSWISGPTLGPDGFAYAGIDLGGASIPNIQSIAFGRSNVLAGDACGVCTDRHLGTYTLQYTQIANPSTNPGLLTTGDPGTGWVDIGTLDYGPTEGPGSNYNNTWQRHRYNFNPVDATGIRLAVSDIGTAIDEIELFDTPGIFVPPPPPPPPFGINPNPGFNIGWDGNDGDNHSPDAIAPVPDNAALASNGSTPFASGNLAIGPHFEPSLNDGQYGNANSWIGADGPPGSVFAGIALNRPIAIDAIAFGRDNGNTVADACGGTCTDRWAGEYILQYTRAVLVNASTPDTGDANTGWQTIGSLVYTLSQDEIIGDLFTGYLRHEFTLDENGQPILATGIRIIVPQGGIAGGTAIDEIEIYGTQIPEPTSIATLSILALASLTYRRHRRNA